MNSAIYNTGTRKMYYYFLFWMIDCYVEPPYREYPPLVNFISSAQDEIRQFSFLYDEKVMARYIYYYFENSNLLKKLFRDIDKSKDFLFQKYPHPFLAVAYDTKTLRLIHNEFYLLLKRALFLNQCVWNLDISGNLFLSKNLLSKGFGFQDIQLLTLSDKRGYLEAENEDFLKVCLTYFKNKKIGRRLLLKHLNKYEYISISYADERPKNLDDYLKQINSLEVRNSGGIKKLIHQKEADYKNSIRERDKLFKTIKDKNIQKTILLLRQAIYGKDYFRGLFSQITHYYINPIINECSRRWKVNPNNLRKLNFVEFNKFFQGKRVDWSVINKRIGDNAAGVIDGRSFMYFAKKAKSFKNKYFKDDISTPKNLTGVVANPGRTKGRVCICLTHDDFK
ncbi:MAG: hypothetical protein ABIJ81_01790, partial [Patescibacteria group bacterium]